MDILEKELIKYQQAITANDRVGVDKLLKDMATSSYELGASVILRAYINGDLDKKKARAILERISDGIIFKYENVGAGHLQ